MLPLTLCRMCKAYSLLDPPPSTATEHAISRYDSTEEKTKKQNKNQTSLSLHLNSYCRNHISTPDYAIFILTDLIANHSYIKILESGWSSEGLI